MRIRDLSDLLGLYQGAGLPSKSVWDPVSLPDRIFLYRIPIIDYARRDGERVERVIRHVLIHEIGHHFGFSDVECRGSRPALSPAEGNPSQSAGGGAGSGDWGAWGSRFGRSCRSPASCYDIGNNVGRKANAMIRIGESDFLRAFDAMSEMARKDPVTITKQGRDRLVVMSAEEYMRLRQGHPGLRRRLSPGAGNWKPPVRLNRRTDRLAV